MLGVTQVTEEHDTDTQGGATFRPITMLMLQAFKAVKKNRGCAGIDKVSIKMFESNLEENLLSLMKDLKQGTYQPKYGE